MTRHHALRWNSTQLHLLRLARTTQDGLPALIHLALDVTGQPRIELDPPSFDWTQHSVPTPHRTKQDNALIYSDQTGYDSICRNQTQFDITRNAKPRKDKTRNAYHRERKEAPVFNINRR